MYPIVMVANFSGNVGKTTLTKNMLAPHMPGVKIFAVEDINAGYNQGEAVQLSAEMTRTILENVMEASFEAPVIVDVGASNVSTFFRELTQYEGMEALIAKVIVPTEPSEKVQKDTVSTVRFLLDELHFDVDKIAVVINRADPKLPIEVVFQEMQSELAKMSVIPAGIIFKNETFQIATQVGMSVFELAEKDMKSLLVESQIESISGEDPKFKVKLAMAAATAKKLKKQLTEIYEVLDIPQEMEV